MSNIKKTAEVSIRLPKQASLPKPQELIEMAHEAKRAKKRIELPWQPEGRPEPCLITVLYDNKTSKSTWSVLTSHKFDAEVAWTDVDPDPTKVVLALRDWYSQARETEGWYKGPLTAGTPDPNLPLQQPQMAPPQPGAVYPQPGYPPQQPYPQQPGGVPVWTPVYQQPYPSYPYPYAVPPAPPHWAQSVPPTPAAPATDQPLAPELWALHSAQNQQSNHLMIGDLLVAAGVIPTKTLQAALTLQNTANMERRRLGEILVSSGALPTRVLDAAVQLQELARSKVITNYRVTEILRQVYSTNAPLNELLGTAGATTAAPLMPRGDQRLEEEGKVSSEEREKLKQVLALLKDFTADQEQDKATELLDLFRKASIISEQTMEAELAANKHNAIDAVKALLGKEIIDPTTFEAGMQCQKLIAKDRLKIEQAVIALGYCSRSRVSLRDAISDLNWLIPIDGI